MIKVGEWKDEYLIPLAHMVYSREKKTWYGQNEAYVQFWGMEITEENLVKRIKQCLGSDDIFIRSYVDERGDTIIIGGTWLGPKNAFEYLDFAYKVDPDGHLKTDFVLV